MAVLPFVNMSSEPEQEYFSDGLSEELINQLAQIRRFRLAGRTSSFAFKGKAVDSRSIGEHLGVDYVLEGSVRKSGQRLRVTAQLVECSDGFSLWSQRFDCELTDVFAIQDEIAHAVAGALSVTLGVGESTRLPGGTDDVQAYDKYLRARALYHQSGPAELGRAIQIYREALALDPAFALAWYGLYTALAYVLVTLPVDWHKEARRGMEKVSERILSLAPDAWWVNAMRTDQLLTQHRWLEAEAAATALLASAPAAEVDALATYATFLMNVGRIGEAVEFIKASADPLSLRVSGHLQLFLDLAGRRDEAQAEFERSRDRRRPPSLGMGRTVAILVAQGRGSGGREGAVPTLHHDQAARARIGAGSG
jgi:TolB-like protein